MQPETNGVRILIVEDSPTQAVQLAYLLQKQGYEVQTARNGQEALTMAQQGEFSLIITDVVMPVMNGYDLCAAIKADTQLRQTPVVLLTSLSEVQDVLKALECGADNFIKKPYDSEYLLSRVAQILINRSIRKTNKFEMGVEINLAGQTHFITFERQQILDVLISIFEEAVFVSDELKRRQQELARANASLSSLYRLAASLNEAVGEQQVIERALASIAELPNVVGEWLLLRQVTLPDEPNLFVGSISQVAASACPCCTRLLGQDTSRRERRVELDYWPAEPTYKDMAHCHLSLPLTVAGRLGGLLHLVSTPQTPFSEDDVKMLSLVASELAVALERAYMHANLEGLVEERTEELKRSEEQYRLLFDSNPHPMWVFDQETHAFLAVNDAAIRHYGYSREEFLGMTIEQIRPPQDVPALQDFLQRLRQPVESLRVASSWQHCRKDGSLIDVEITVGELSFDGHPAMIVLANDITERKRYEARIEYLAGHDALTGLPNLSLLTDRLEQAIAQQARTRLPLAVFSMDVDDFKFFNDSFDHVLGDKLLKVVAERISGCLRPGDTVARQGGDEFLIMLPNLSCEEETTTVAQQLLEAMTRVFVVDQQQLFLTCSIGIAVAPRDGEDAPTILKNADTALFRAKEMGKNNFQHYTTEMTNKSLDRLQLEQKMRTALLRQEFILHYQPKVNLTTGRITGVEALIRWLDPDLGMISPNRFVPLAEETGLILPMGAWVLETACAQARAWQKAGLPPLVVAVNLSARQFRTQNLVAFVRQVLEKTGLAPQYLALELTESSVMESPDSAICVLKALRDMGVTLAIDDFGTGYSSLSYLRRLPIHTLKLDRSFILDITSNRDDAAIADAIMAMAHTMNHTVVAEGVETQEQMEYLRAHQCDEMQGYYFSRPVEAATMENMLRQGRTLVLDTSAKLT